MDWRPHITEAPDHRRLVRDTGIEVARVVELLLNGATASEVLARLPGLTAEDVAACIEFSTEQLDAERHAAAFHAEIRRRIAEDDAHPERAIPVEEAERRLRAGTHRPETDRK